MKWLSNKTSQLSPLQIRYMLLERRIKYFLYDFNDFSSIFTGPMRSKNTPDLCADIHMYIDDWPWIGRDKKVYQKFKYMINASLPKLL